MLKQKIIDLSNQYMLESQNAPNLFEDLAAMERYMSESYSQRIFVELLQNADDAQATEILVIESGEDIIVANNGRPFTADDIVTISRSGASKKVRGESIGYRGIGFKSTTALTDEIIIFSANMYFTFSKQLCAQQLGVPAQKTPTIRVPFLVDCVPNEIETQVNLLRQKGYTTIFIFKHAHKSDFEQELSLVNKGYFLFLNNICNCTIDVGRIFVVHRVHRVKSWHGTYVELDNQSDSKWLIKENGSVAIAFLCQQGNIVPCSPEEAVMHSYLPTEDSSPYFCKINGNFSTDPSRKHIVTDTTTEELIRQSAGFLAETIQECISNPTSLGVIARDILSVVKPTNSYLKYSILFRKHFDELIRSEQWLTTADGNQISLPEYNLLPRWLEPAEVQLLRCDSTAIQGESLPHDTYENIAGLDQFIARYSTQQFAVGKMIQLLTDASFTEAVPKELHIKMIIQCIKEDYSNAILSPDNCDNDWENVYVYDGKSQARIKDLSPSDTQTRSVISDIAKNLSSEEVSWFSAKLEPYTDVKQLQTPSNSRRDSIVTKKIAPLTKWRSAEQQCLDIERKLGNVAFDVSLQNVGYDIESTCPDGSKRYIEVKSVQAGGDFSITNNEYTAAHQYGDSYILCLIRETSDKVIATYITNPLKTAKFEKRVKQWEWACLDYTGNEVSYDVE